MKGEYFYGMSEITKVEEFRVMEFLKNLPIPSKDKKKLVLAIAAIMVNTGEDSTRMATAACMGLSVEDEKFNAFYNSDIRPIVQLDIQTIYNQLADKILEEDSDILYSKELISSLANLLGCDPDGDIIYSGINVYYIEGCTGVFRKLESKNESEEEQ